MALIYAQIDCDLPRDRRMISAGPMARLLYIQFVLYCRENLTDGEVAREQLAFVAVDIPKAHKLIEKLLEVGALDPTEIGWRIPMPVWRKRNPLRAEVEQKRQEEAERKQAYRDRQKSENVPTGQSVTATRCPGQEETKTEEETKTSLLLVVGKPKPDGFADWWELYPRKVAKADALKAWKATKDKPPVDELIEACAPLRRRPSSELEFIPYPATWLRKRRWEDEAPRQQPPSTLNGVPVSRFMQG